MPVPAAATMSQSAKLTFDRLRNSVRTGMANPGSIQTGSMQRGVRPLDFPDYIDGICDAICSAWGTWQRSASLVGVVINAVSATGGTVVGPPLTPLIQAGGPRDTVEASKLTQIISNSLGVAWMQFTASLSVPGLPWYPAFAAFPAPIAPPTPNLPMPVASFSMSRLMISKAALKVTMVAQSNAPDHQNLFEAIAQAFTENFEVWRVSTMVTNVLGTGPVPSFAPPFVLVGPVVGGVGTMPPGGFI